MTDQPEDRTVTDPYITCITCDNSGYQSEVRGWHSYRHPLRTNLDQPQGQFKASTKPNAGDDASSGGKTSQDAPQGMGWPFDPVLRQALMDKGVLTPEDLSNAEARIRAVSGQFAPTLRTIVENGDTDDTTNLDVHQPEPGQYL